jgi:hypothetical protein
MMSSWISGFQIVPSTERYVAFRNSRYKIYGKLFWRRKALRRWIERSELDA